MFHYQIKVLQKNSAVCRLMQQNFAVTSEYSKRQGTPRYMAGYSNSHQSTFLCLSSCNDRQNSGQHILNNEINQYKRVNELLHLPLTYQVLAKLRSRRGHCLASGTRSYSTSSLFISDQKTNTSSFEFDHQLDRLLSDLHALQSNLQQRGCDIDVKRLKDGYVKFCELKEQRQKLESRRESIAKQIAVIVKHQKESATKSKEAGNKLKKLKEEGKAARETLKTTLSKYWEMEETVMMTALKLPNTTLPSVSNEVVILEEHFEERQPTEKVDHYEILARSHCVKLSNVGAKSYYLTGRLAILEQELIERLSSLLTAEGASLILAPEIFKTPVVEGSGLDCMDPASVYRLLHKQGTDLTDWDQDHLFLTGSSHLSFIAYYARMLIETDNLPLKKFTVGRSYTPDNEATSDLPGLFQTLQTVKVCMAGLSATHDKCLETMKDFQSVLSQLYKQFSLPFRIVSMPVQSLHPWEQNRIEYQIWIPSIQQYLKLASVSLHGDFTSRRLMIRCAQHKNAVSYPVSMVYVEVADITRFIAVLLEYGLTHKHWI